MDRGYIKLFRKLRDNDLWKAKPFSRGQAWVDLLMSAAYRESMFEKRGTFVKLKPGQIGISKRGLADRWGWSPEKVERFLVVLENESQIEYQKNNVTTLITIKNWSEYNQNESQNEPQTNHKRTANEYKEEVKEGKEVKEETYMSGKELLVAYSKIAPIGLAPSPLIIKRFEKIAKERTREEIEAALLEMETRNARSIEKFESYLGGNHKKVTGDDRWAEYVN